MGKIRMEKEKKQKGSFGKEINGNKRKNNFPEAPYQTISTIIIHQQKYI